jgi:hypothetical protein
MLNDEGNKKVLKDAIAWLEQNANARENRNRKANIVENPNSSD